MNIEKIEKNKLENEDSFIMDFPIIEQHKDYFMVIPLKTCLKIQNFINKRIWEAGDTK